MFYVFNIGVKLSHCIKLECDKPHYRILNIAVRMVPCTIRTAHTTYAASLKTTTHPKTRCRKPYAATQHIMLLMRGVFTRNISS